MKRIALTLIISFSLILSALAQEKEEKLKELEEMEQKAGGTVPGDTLIIEETDSLATVNEDIFIGEEETPEDETSRVKIGDVVTVEETDDETVIRIGHKGVRIIEGDDDTEIKFEEYPEEEYKDHPGRKFKGHLGGIEWGFNNYSPERWKTSLDPEDPLLEVNTSKSDVFNLLLPPVSLGFAPHFGLVAAVGISWNDYRFDANSAIMENEEGTTVSYFPPNPESVEKSKLVITYAILPVMLEAQIPVHDCRTINIGAGVIGAVKLGSFTKIVYSGDEGKIKDKDDFNLNLLRWGATARVGFEMFQVYGTYYMTPMFESGKGPELYQYEIGIALTFNN